MVDVSTSIVIQRPRSEVADFAMEPSHAPRWYANIHVAHRLPRESPGSAVPAVGAEAAALAVGDRFRFEARFLGRTLAYTYEVRELIPGELLVMSTAEGPFPMRTTYRFDDAAGGTRMELRNDGVPSGFFRLAAPLLGRMMERENRKDLMRLKAVLEA